MTPHINHLGVMSPVVRVSTHIYRVSKEIDWKTFIFSVNLNMETPQIDCVGKSELF